MLITLATFNSLMDAQLARARLAANGIQATLPDEHMLNTDWFYTQALGGVRLQVAPADVEAAREVLAQPDDNAFSDEEAGEIEAMRAGMAPPPEAKEPSVIPYVLGLFILAAIIFLANAVSTARQ